MKSVKLMNKYKLTLDDVDKYLDNTYSSQIYTNDDDFRKVQTELKNLLIAQGINYDTCEYSAF